jgi:hypothetical protein
MTAPIPFPVGSRADCMSTQQYRDAMKELGLNHAGMAELLGINMESSKRYVLDHPVHGRKISNTIRNLIMMALHEGRAVAPDTNGSATYNAGAVLQSPSIVPETPPPISNANSHPSIPPEMEGKVVEFAWRARANGGGSEAKPGNAGTAKPVRFKLVSFDELKSSTALYLVKSLFPRNGLVIVWGPPKCGKSFWVFTVAMYIALGWEYRGHRVKQDEVVYLVLEGQAGFGNRKEAFKQRFLKPDQTVPAFKLCDVSLNLAKDHCQLIADIRAQHANPGCIIIDTMNRSLVGSESSDEDMSAYLNAATAVQQAFNCLIVIIHHCGIDDSRPRGHTSQTGAVDVQISVKKDEGTGIVTATVDLAKDMAEGATFASKLTVVELGTDPDGDPITSCVIEPVEAEPEAENQAQRRGKKRDRLPKKAQIALRALREAADELGAEPPASNHIPPKVKTVTVDQWRQYAYARGISDGEERAKQKAFKEASDHLIAEQFVGSWNNARWVANKDEN